MKYVSVVVLPTPVTESLHGLTHTGRYEKKISIMSNITVLILKVSFVDGLNK